MVALEGKKPETFVFLKMMMTFSTMLVMFITFEYAAGERACYMVVLVSEGSGGQHGNYSCPKEGQPKIHTECCTAANYDGCCPRIRAFYEIDRTLASVIAISVVSVCIFVAILMAVCCFWSKCPLFSACRAEFTHDIATYESKEDSINLDTMPTEFSIKSTNKFSPVVVSNGNLPLDAEAM